MYPSEQKSHDFTLTRKLARTVSLRGALAINLGAIIGAGIFVIIGLAAEASGPAIVLSIVISALVALFTGLSFSEIARHTAKEGGVYEYAKETLSPFAGFIGGWLWTFGNIIALSAVSLSLGSYIDALFRIHISNIYFAVPTILVLMLINILGIKNSTKTLTVFVGINVLVLVVFVIFGAMFFHASNFSNFFGEGANGLLEGAALIFFAFTGFSRVTTIGEEVKDSERTIPRAIILSIILSTILYIFVAVVAVGLVPSAELGHSASPLSFAISALKNPLLDAVIALGGITATAGVVLTGILGTSRVFFAMGRDNELPSVLSYIDKFSTPIYSIVLSSVLGVLFLLFVSFSTIVETANASILLAYFIVNISALNLHVKLRKIGKPGRHLGEKRWFFAIPVFGMITIALVTSYVGIRPLLLVLALGLIGIIYYAYKTAKSLKNVEKFVSREIPIRSIVREFGTSRQKRD
ncbi:MAG: APC family permease [Candidatus Micrarchaeaceae archaeon]